MLESLPTSPDGIGIAVADRGPVEGGWRVRLAIPGDLHGPDGILQGGLTAALVRAAVVAGSGEGVAPAPGDVTSVLARLQRPTPVGALVDATVTADGPMSFSVTIANGDEITATGEVDVSGPPPVPHLPDLLELGDAPIPPARPDPRFPHCIVCGQDNPRGLHILPHPVANLGQDIAPWEPDERVDDGNGRVHPVATAAVLDCPGPWAALSRVGLDGPDESVILLAEYRVQWFAAPELGEDCRTVGLVDDITGRKARVRTALLDEQRRITAMATALHILAPAIPPRPTPAVPLT